MLYRNRPHNYHLAMSRDTRLLHNALPLLLFTCGMAAAWPPIPDTRQDASPNLEINVTQGDTRKGSRVQVRIMGDSVQYRSTLYSPSGEGVPTVKSAPLDPRRRKALQGVMDKVPGYHSFGSCHGKGMRYYLVETPEGKFYRSLPEMSGNCYTDEPGIRSLFDDLDELLAPPEDAGEREYSVMPVTPRPDPSGAG
jgi:hypothetical protein